MCMNKCPLIVVVPEQAAEDPLLRSKWRLTLPESSSGMFALFATRNAATKQTVHFRNGITSHKMISYSSTRCVSQLVNAFGLPREKLRETLASLADVKPAASDDIFWHLHNTALDSWNDISVVGLRKQQQLAEALELVLPSIVEDSTGEDGTRKWLLKLADGALVETVFIPELVDPDHAAPGSRKVDRGVLCVSSQVGCSLACSFCHTGTQALKRNLKTHEITGQLHVAKQALRAPTAAAAPAPQVTNVVFMGQGEPLYNWRAVSDAVRIMTDRRGGNIAHKRCTISTSGVAPHMAKVGSELGVNLALSLHATEDATRSGIMNVNRSFPLPVVLHACREYRDAVYTCPEAVASRSAREANEAARGAARRHALHSSTTAGGSLAEAAAETPPSQRRTGRRILFEYTLLEGVNDSLEDARRLVQLTAEFNCHVNIIPFNPWPGAPYKCPPDEQVMQFGKVLLQRGVTASIRWPRGRDIMAACGQLHSAHTQQQAEEDEGHATALQAGVGGTL